MKLKISTLFSTALILVIGIVPCRVFSQNIKLNAGVTAVTITKNTDQKIVFKSTVSDIGTMEVSTVEGKFSAMSISGFG